MEKAYYEIEKNSQGVIRTAKALLSVRGFEEISNLLSMANIYMVNTDYDNWNGGIYGYTTYIQIPVSQYAKLTKEEIHSYEDEIASALNEATKGEDTNNFYAQILPFLCGADINWDIIGGEKGKTILKNDIVKIKNYLISSGTGGVRINDVDQEYQNLCKSIYNKCKDLNIPYSNTFHSLWDWYAYYSKNLPTYQSRRDFINKEFSNLLDYFCDNHISSITDIMVELSDWERINRTVVKIKKDSVIARNEESFQQIGLLCREAIISLAEHVYNWQDYGTTDEEGTLIGKTDAVRMIENYLGVKLPGSSNEELRKYAKDTNKLANMLTHKRNATKLDMLLTVNATIALINFIGIIENKV